MFRNIHFLHMRIFTIFSAFSFKQKSVVHVPSLFRRFSVRKRILVLSLYTIDFLETFLETEILVKFEETSIL